MGCGTVLAWETQDKPRRSLGEAEALPSPNLAHRIGPASASGCGRPRTRPTTTRSAGNGRAAHPPAHLPHTGAAPPERTGHRACPGSAAPAWSRHGAQGGGAARLPIKRPSERRPDPTVIFTVIFHGTGRPIMR